MAGSDRRGKMSSFPDPVELKDLERQWDEDPSVFDRITAVPGETLSPDSRAPEEDEAISGLHERMTPIEPLPHFSGPGSEAPDRRPPESSNRNRRRGSTTQPGMGAVTPPTAPASEAPSLEIELAELESEPPPPPHEALEIDLPQQGSPPLIEPAGPAAAAELADMRDRYRAGDFSGALFVAEGVLEADPGNEEARRCRERCAEVLSQMYLARLGSLTKVVRVALPNDQIRWLSLDHRAGFLLSLVDGHSTVEEILDISGMPRLDALRILYGLIDQRVIALS